MRVLAGRTTVQATGLWKQLGGLALAALLLGTAPIARGEDPEPAIDPALVARAQRVKEGLAKLGLPRMGVVDGAMVLVSARSEAKEGDAGFIEVTCTVSTANFAELLDAGNKVLESMDRYHELVLATDAKARVYLERKRWEATFRRDDVCVGVKWAFFPPEDPNDQRSQEILADEALPKVEALVKRAYEAIGSGRGPDLPVVLLDGNPGTDFGDQRGTLSIPSEERLTYAVSANCKRKGTTADGASLLLIRVTTVEGIIDPKDSIGQGKVRFALEGEGAVGTLHRLEDDPWATPGAPTLEDVAVVTPPKFFLGRCAFAVYKPPQDFGSGHVREFKVRATFTPSAPGAPAAVADCPIVLIRPPVVLVHGTYDNPKACWQSKMAPGMSKMAGGMSMEDCLKQEGFRPFLADWEETNGSKDPSSFQANRARVWTAPGGIRDALAAFRKDEFAATRADLVCHSQGGVIARVYAGTNEFRRPDNFQKGDINRLVTISSTHMGSDVPKLLYAYKKFAGSTIEDFKLWPSLFVGWVHKVESPIFTGGVHDQVPGSDPLCAIPATPVRAHAIGCVCDDEDLDDFGGEYRKRLEKILWGSSPAMLDFAFRVHLQQAADADAILAQKRAVDEIWPRYTELRDGLANPQIARGEPVPADILRGLMEEFERLDRKVREAEAVLRRVVFVGDRNDCTVRLASSHGGLSGSYVSTIEHALHGYAPRYSAVQNRVVEILNSEGDALFAPNGFPRAYP